MRTILASAIAATLLSLASCGQQESTERDLSEILSDRPTVAQFTEREGNERDAVWSPDGKWIVFGGGQNGHQLWRKPVAGGEAVQLTSGEAGAVYPA